MSLPLFDVPGGVTEEMPTPAAIKHTERTMLDALHARYSQASQGQSVRWACAEHVRSHASFEAKRTCDFMAQDLWLSGKLELHGHEVKVSRSDWLRELADPSKAEEFRRFCDRWWLVVPDPSIVRADLPTGWGLIALGRGGRLVVVKQAPHLSPEPHPPTFRAALLRATAKTNARRGSVVAQIQAEADRWQRRYGTAVEEYESIRRQLAELRAVR